MTNALRQNVVVKSNGVIEIRSPELLPGMKVEVIVLVENSPAVDAARESRLQALKELFQSTQALPQAQTISEDEIAGQVAAYRAGRS
jgi:hypothetical protein